MNDDSYHVNITNEILERWQEILDDLAAEVGFSDAEMEQLIYTDVLSAKMNQYLIDRIQTVDEQVHLLAIMFDSESDLNKALMRLNEGEEFEDLAAELNPSEELRANKGDLGWLARSSLEENLASSVFDEMEVGQISEPFLLGESYALFYVVAHEQARERDPATIFSHQMPGATDGDLLQHTAELSLTTGHTADRVMVTVDVTNTLAGHHIPTDSPLRQILLVVEATDSQDNELQLVEGPILPKWAGDLAGQPGVYFAKILQELWTEVMPTGAYWNPTRVVEDTRLPALETHTSSYTFAIPSAIDEDTISIEAHLYFRRAFYDLVQQKNWDVPDIQMEQIATEIQVEKQDRTGRGYSYSVCFRICPTRVKCRPISWAIFR